jgi:hypothetical protein
MTLIDASGDERRLARTFRLRTTAHPRMDRVSGRTASSLLRILRVAQNDGMKSV